MESYSKFYFKPQPERHFCGFWPFW